MGRLCRCEHCPRFASFADFRRRVISPRGFSRVAMHTSACFSIRGNGFRAIGRRLQLRSFQFASNGHVTHARKFQRIYLADLALSRGTRRPNSSRPHSLPLPIDATSSIPLPTNRTAMGQRNAGTKKPRRLCFGEATGARWTLQCWRRVQRAPSIVLGLLAILVCVLAKRTHGGEIGSFES
jgi:hypothetical protein